ncbi:MAG TPA: Gfo/Idh/MocA family oxidoreductase [Thermoanaerobaculia bacterium]
MSRSAATPVAALVRRGTPQLAFAGLGWIGRHRMNAVVDAGLAEAAYTCDVDTPMTFDDVLRSDADAIVIATPSAMHAEQAIAALEHGKAVFCQKPLGRNADETRRVVEAARANDRLLGVDLSYRYTEAMRAVRKLVPDLGRIYAADLVFHNAYGPDKPWFYDARQSGGGCVIDLGIHLVDLALWILGGRATSVHARLHHHGGHDVEDYAVAMIDISGATVQLACSWNLSAGQDAEIRVVFYGTNGAAAFRNVNGSFYDFVAEHHQKTQKTRLTEPGDAWGGGAICAWAEQLGRSNRFDPSIEHVVDVAEVLDAIYRSGRR